MGIEHETVEKMRLTYRQLFKGNDPFMEVFTDKLPHRLFLCPTEGYFLTEEQYLALNKTVKAIGESTFFLSEIEGEPDFSDKSCHWRIHASTSYREYCQLPIYLENIIYSEAGNWGVIISHEEHALFGGGLLYHTII